MSKKKVLQLAPDTSLEQTFINDFSDQEFENATTAVASVPIGQPGLVPPLADPPNPGVFLSGTGEFLSLNIGVLDAVLTGLDTSVGGEVVSQDTILIAIGKLENKVTVLEETSTFTWPQTTPLAIWTISHPLNKYPSVSIVDSAGTLVEGNVEYPSISQVIIMFSSAFSGTAILN